MNKQLYGLQSNRAVQQPTRSAPANHADVRIYKTISQPLRTKRRVKLTSCFTTVTLQLRTSITTLTTVILEAIYGNFTVRRVNDADVNIYFCKMLVCISSRRTRCLTVLYRVAQPHIVHKIYFQPHDLQNLFTVDISSSVTVNSVLDWVRFL